MGETERGADVLDEWLTSGGAEYLSRFTSSMVDVVGVIDHDLVIRYVNWTVPGVRREDVVGASTLGLIPPADHEVAKEAFQRSLSMGQTARFEMTYRGAGGVIVFVVRVSPILHDGRVIGALTLNSDVTEERRERMDRDRFFSLSLDMLIVATSDGILRRLNPAFSAALGYSPQELGGRPFLDFVHPDDREATHLAYLKVLSGTPVEDFENRYQRRDGSFRTFSWRATVDPVTGDVYAVARDITAHRATELELRHAQKMEAVGQLAGGVAHDFNNLMQAVLSNVEMALVREGLPPLVADHLREIGAAGDRAAELTKQLLYFSRQKPLDSMPVDLHALIRGLEKLLRRLLPENIQIVLDLASEVPTATADKGQLEQVVINLCVNARDAMEAGGVLTIKTAAVEIQTSDCEAKPWARPGRFVCLSVSDTGVGMSREVQERAFDPFFTTKGHKSGTGLGLATLYGIIQQHRGLVNVASDEGQGAIFEVYLPEDGRPAEDAKHPERQVDVPGKGTILLAEDEERVRNPVLQFLQNAGYRTLSAKDGYEAVEMFERHASDIDLVVLDVVMPRLGGPEAWERMCAIRPGLPVLFTSGYADDAYRRRIPQDAEVLDKPFQIRTLLAKIRELLLR